MSILPIVIPAGEGDALQFSPTELLTWKATQATTGAFDQFELTAQPNHAGAPLHVHATVEECFYVLTGAFRFAVASSEVIAEPGSFLFVPRGTAHTWTNAAETASTMLLTFVPGGMKPFFDEAAPVMHARPLDLDALTAINARHATTVVGPPLPPAPDLPATPAR
jgi:quercetin dioxygenase-like cupin family protein